MYPLFESIRVERGSVQHWSWHQARMSRSLLRYCGHSSLVHLPQSLPLEHAPKAPLIKAKLYYDHQEFSLEFEPYTPRPVRHLRLLMEPGISYRLKWSDRGALQDAFEQRGECDDVLMVSRGCITDTTYANIVFFDGQQWYTPSTPLLEGTQRAYCLARGVIKARVIRPQDLSDFTAWQIINAMLPFDPDRRVPIENISSSPKP